MTREQYGFAFSYVLGFGAGVLVTLLWVFVLRVRR